MGLESGQRLNVYEFDRLGQIGIDKPFLDEDILIGHEKIIKTPLSTHEREHLIVKTISGKRYLEKPISEMDYNRYDTISHTTGYINEFFQSRLLLAMKEVGVLKEQILVPSIKLTTGNPFAYYSEYIPDTFSCMDLNGELFKKIAIANDISIKTARGLSENAFTFAYGVMQAMDKDLIKELRKKENAAPLALLHLVCGDRDRAMSNYRFQKTAKKNIYNIAVLDMEGGEENTKGFIGINLLADLKVNEVMSYWPYLESIIVSNALVTKISEALPLSVPPNRIDLKKDEVIYNMKHIRVLVEEEIDLANRAKKLR